MVSGYNETIPWTNIVLLGTSQQGKSTLAGFLLQCLAEVNARVMKEARQAAIQRNVPTQKFAFLLDRIPSERASRKTLENSWWGFTRAGRRYLLIDTPGLYDHTPSVIGALLEADAALLVIDVHDYLNNLSIDEQHPPTTSQPNSIAQIRQKLAIAYFLGIRSLGIILHKMDTIYFAQNDYRKIQHHLEVLLQKQGWDMRSVSFLPTAIDTLHEQGHNIVNRSKEFAWFAGATLIQTIERFIPNHSLAKQHLCIQLSKKNAAHRPSSILGVDLLLKGSILTGQVRVNDTLFLHSSRIQCKVTSIESIDCSNSTERAEYWGKQLFASAGESVSLTCTTITHKKLSKPKSGEIATLNQQTYTLVKNISITPMPQEYAHHSLYFPPLTGWLVIGYVSTKFRLVQISTEYGQNWLPATKKTLSLMTQNKQISINDTPIPFLFEISLQEPLPVELYLQTPILQKLLLFDTHWHLFGGYQLVAI